MSLTQSTKQTATSFVRERTSEELRAFINRKLQSETLQNVALFE